MSNYSCYNNATGNKDVFDRDNNSGKTDVSGDTHKEQYEKFFRLITKTTEEELGGFQQTLLLFGYATLVVSNLLLIYGIYKTRRPMSMINKLFIAISVADILMGFSFLILLKTFEDPDGYVYYFMAVAFLYFFHSIDISAFAIVSWLRYQSIKRPLDVTDKRMLIRVMLVLITVSLIPLFLQIPIDELKLRHYAYLITYIIVLAFGIFNAFINIKSYIILREKSKLVSRTIRVTCKSGDINIVPIQSHAQMGEMAKSIKKKQRTIKTLLIITLCYIVCTFPRYIQGIEWELTHVQTAKDVIVAHYLTSLQFWFYIINSLIYMVRTKEIRKNVFCCSNNWSTQIRGA